MPLSKNTEKYVRSLSQKKFRQLHNRFIGEGDKLVKEILSNESIKIEILFALEEWYAENEQLVKSRQSKVEIVSSKELRKISQLKTPNQVLVVAEQLDVQLNPKDVQSSWSLYLDRIQDPGNMGTLLRIADWFDIRTVFYAPSSAETYNPKVIQASMGAFLRVQHIEMEFEDLQQQFPDLPTYATVMNGTSVHDAKNNQKGIITLGNEGKGIASEIIAKTDHKITIPSYGKSKMESLNVAVAAGIICAVLKKK
ncbi:MAG: RNA methyltransferase [Bacteroidota bacterium]